MRRILVSGYVVAPLAPALPDGLREVLIDVEDNGAHQIYSVMLATSEARAECADLVENALVAFSGFADPSSRDPLVRRLNAERALVVREPRQDPKASLQEGLDILERKAFLLGALSERSRIGTIIFSPNAPNRLFAMELALGGLSPEAAEAAFALARLGAASTPVDAGASLTH
jgi:hypothetical protein